MNFNNHSKLKDQHAFLSASKYHWLRYDEQKLHDSYFNFLAAQMGTRIHAFAANCIELKQKLPKSSKTLNQYVNDAIGFKMSPEVTLFYSENCFGTADSIMFRDNVLRIHDLKTGIQRAHIDQLMIYAALFCLEYDIRPGDIDIILRIYQSNDIIEVCPTAEDVLPVMDKIVSFDNILKKMKSEDDGL